MSLLIDADYIVYKCCAANEAEIDWGDDVIVVSSRFSEAYNMVERELFKIANDLGCFDDSILFLLIVSISVNELIRRIKDIETARNHAGIDGSSTSSRRNTTLL